MESSPPVNYKGRIVVSTTDDTEAKVIEHYGGKKWRRITNFLRGVENHSDECGKKVGEAYVCLRESNVPIHQHNANVKSVETTRTQAWMKHDSPGQTKVVDSPKGETDTGFSLKNVDVDYQFSPLEYGAANSPTIPHDNMPPYMEVFAWECLEATEDEKRWSGEPTGVQYKVTFHFGDGTTNPIEFDRGQEESLGELPEVPTRDGYASDGNWYYEDGTQVQTSDTVTANKHCHIEWQLKTHDVTFVWKTGKEVNYTYQHGQKIGDMALPIPTDNCKPSITNPNQDDWKFLGWFTAQSDDEINPSIYVTDDMVFYAHWQPITKTHDNFKVTFDPANTSSSTPAPIWVDCGASISAIPEVSWDGHRFMEWCDKYGTVLTASTRIYATTEYTAQWETFVPTITWKFNNGTADLVARQLYGTPIEPPIGFAKTGYSFVDWQPSVASIATVDESYSAQWQANQYSVYFDDGYGSMLSAMAVTYDQPYGSLPEVSRSGHAFQDWRVADYYGSYPVTSSSNVQIDASHTLTAQWIASTYSLFFSANGGDSVDYPSKTVTFAQPIGELPEASWGDKPFQGWFTSESGGGRVLPTDYYTVTMDTTVFAHWEVMCQVSWDMNDGSEPVTMEVEQGFVVGELPVASRNGYSFTGWFTSSEGGDSVYASTTVMSDVTFYAQWNILNYAIAYSMGETVPAHMPAEAWTTYNVESNIYGYEAPEPIVDTGHESDYRFTGWEPNGIPENTTGDLTFSAMWAIDVECYQTVGADTTIFSTSIPIGGQVELSEATKKLDNTTTVVFATDGGVDVSLPDHTPTEDNTYEFSYSISGWSDNDGHNYASDATPSFYKSTKLYAQWADTTHAFALPSTSFSNHTFQGWYDEAGGLIGQVGDTYIVTADATLYAHWNPARFTVKFNANGGKDDWQERMDEGEPIVAPTVTMLGHTFVGWMPSVDATVPPHDVEYSAQWSVNQYTMTFDANGGEGGSVVTQDYGTELSAPEVSMSGYAFVDWDPSVPTTVPASDMTFIAQWEPNQPD